MEREQAQELATLRGVSPAAARATIRAVVSKFASWPAAEFTSVEQFARRIDEPAAHASELVQALSVALVIEVCSDGRVRAHSSIAQRIADEKERQESQRDRNRRKSAAWYERRRQGFQDGGESQRTRSEFGQNSVTSRSESADEPGQKSVTDRSESGKNDGTNPVRSRSDADLGLARARAATTTTTSPIPPPRGIQPSPETVQRLSDQRGEDLRFKQLDRLCSEHGGFNLTRKGTYPTLLRWIEAGLSDDELVQALDIAGGQSKKLQSWAYANGVLARWFGSPERLRTAEPEEDNNVSNLDEERDRIGFERDIPGAVTAPLMPEEDPRNRLRIVQPSDLSAQLAMAAKDQEHNEPGEDDEHTARMRAVAGSASHPWPTRRVSYPAVDDWLRPGTQWPCACRGCGECRKRDGDERDYHVNRDVTRRGVAGDSQPIRASRTVGAICEPCIRSLERTQAANRIAAGGDIA